MAMTMHCDIVSAEEEIFSGTIIQLVATAEHGEVGILPRHSQYIARLRPGQVRITTQDGEEQFFYVSGGVLEVQPHVVTVLADTAQRARDIDEAAAQRAKEEAERALHDREAEVDLAHAQAELAEAVAKLQAVERLRRAAKR
jgi:F-type H+-transporting ATPase subunit epsilon